MEGFIVFTLILAILASLVLLGTVIYIVFFKDKIFTSQDSQGVAEAETAATEETVELEFPVDEVADKVAKKVLSKLALKNMVAPEVLEEENIQANNVTLTRETLSREEKYAQLSDEQKRFYDEIVSYAESRTGAKHNVNKSFELFRIARAQFLRLTINRGKIVCDFHLPHEEYDNYVAVSGVAVKKAPTKLVVTDEASLKAAKDSVDIIVNELNRIREVKKAKELAERKEKARQKRAEVAKAIAESEQA